MIRCDISKDEETLILFIRNATEDQMNTFISKLKVDEFYAEIIEKIVQLRTRS